MQSGHDKQHVVYRSRWTKAALLLWEYPLGRAVVAEAGRDKFQQHYAMSGQQAISLGHCWAQRIIYEGL